MARYDTTATCTQDASMERGGHENFSRATFTKLSFRNQSGGGGDAVLFGSLIVSFRIPSQPSGVDSLDRVKIRLTGKQTEYQSPAAAHDTKAFSLGNLPWTENFLSYNSYATNSTWPAGTTKGSQVATHISRLQLPSPVSTISGSSFAWDVTALKLTWEDHGQIGISYATYVIGGSPPSSTYGFFSLQASLSTTTWYPTVVVTFTDNPPDAISDLIVVPDTSLSEASYTFRQRALLKWTASDANDFSRYRIRFGVNRSLAANHTHKAFVSSRASNSYLDTTLYTDASTIYYSVYVEDTRNKSASTNANVSNVVSWTKPDAVVGSVSIGSSASTLQEIEARVRTTTMANGKKAKVVWGDNAYTFSENLTSAGGYFYARHRYTKATSGYTIRALVEDINGFRSALDSYGTSVTISNLGPVAKLSVSPSRQRTASTFNFGNAFVSVAGDWSGMFLFPASSTSASLSNGVATSFRFKTGTSTSAYQIALLRPESGNWRIIYAQSVSAATVLSEVRRNVNWKIEKGDIPAINATSGAATVDQDTTRNGYFFSMSSSVSVNQMIPRWRASQNANTVKIRLSYALTNPVHFSAKDSFARGSNRVVNRFRWDTDYNGTFGSNFETGA